MLFIRFKTRRSGRRQNTKRLLQDETRVVVASSRKLNFTEKDFEPKHSTQLVRKSMVLDHSVTLPQQYSKQKNCKK